MYFSDKRTDERTHGQQRWIKP